MIQYELFSLKQIEPFYQIIQSPQTAMQKLTIIKSNKQPMELIVFKAENGQLFLAEGYEYFFALTNSKEHKDVFCRVGDYVSELDARYAALRELLLTRSRWSAKMDQFLILFNQFNQDRKEIAKKLGVTEEKVNNYLLDSRIPPSIRVQACKNDLGKMANSIARCTLSMKLKNILYEFVTYPTGHPLRISDEIFRRARLLLRKDSRIEQLLFDDIRDLIIKHAFEHQKRAIERYRCDLDKMVN